MGKPYEPLLSGDPARKGDAHAQHKRAICLVGCSGFLPPGADSFSLCSESRLAILQTRWLYRHFA